MFTSNGLICLSGVTMCRMCLSAMRRLPYLSQLGRVGVHVRRYLSAAIERSADADVYTLAFGAALYAREHAFGGVERRDKSVTGRTPGALPDADGAFVLEQRERRRDRAAGKAMSALRRREIIADPPLQLLDAGTESGQVGFDHRRKNLHDEQAAEICRFRIGGRRQTREGAGLTGAMHALPLRVEHDHNAPAIREVQAADHRWRLRHRATAAIDREAAAFEQGDAGA